MSKALWKFYCMEDDYPGLWLRWLKNQCVAVGWPPNSGYHLDGETKHSSGWTGCKNALLAIKVGDIVIASMARSRVGRIGEIIKLSVKDDQWEPLVPVSKELPYGEMGRRVLVRWDLNVGPSDFDLVIKLPERTRFTGRGLRATIAQVTSPSIHEVKDAMNDPTNWTGLFGQFAYEKALSDYIANYPHRLEDGLTAYPNSIIREKVFPDRSRLDVLLADKRENPVVVECKQHSPSIDDLKQLERYIENVQRETGKKARGILVHGGTPKLRKDVANFQKAHIEIVSYSLDIDFKKSG